MKIDLTDKVAVVTGGAAGIGEHLSRRLAAEGAHVVIGDVNEEQGQLVASDIGGAFLRCDVTRPEDSQAVIDFAVSSYGGVDIVALNAGIMTTCGIGDDFDIDVYRRAMSINLDGVVY